MKAELLKNRLCVILTNYGDDSLALIQWALKSDLLKPLRSQNLLKVVYIDTGFAASTWALRVQQGQEYLEKHGIEAIHLRSPISFQDSVLGRNAFPTPKFQWCSTVLKGLPLLDWLDSVDTHCQSVILLAKRRETLLSPYDTLPEWVEHSEHYNNRSLWHPLIEYDEAMRNALLGETQIMPLGHRSLECDPCVNSNEKTLSLLSDADILKVKNLESAIGNPMFPSDAFRGVRGIEAVVQQAGCSLQKSQKFSENDKKCFHLQETSLFYRGCGNPFGCGL